MRRILVLSTFLAAALLPSAPALADTTQVVHGLEFSASGDHYLAWLGCTGIYDSSHEDVSSYYDLGPATPPMGRRSLRYDLAGGNAIGSFHGVASMLGTSVAGLSIAAPQGASGVAYAGYQAPADVGTPLIWVGRVSLSEAAGGWRTVDVADRSYDWTRYDTSTTKPTPVGAGGSATVAEFVGSHGGDGAGFYSIGFGCDGNPFNMDAWRIGSPGNVTTYDLEGVSSTTGISGPSQPVDQSGSVVLSGTLHDTGGAAIPNAPLTLEAQLDGNARFAPVGTAYTNAQGVASLTVAAPRTTVYRWRYADSGYADGSVSPTFEVQVAAGAPQPSPPPSTPSTPSTPSSPSGPSQPSGGSTIPAPHPTTSSSGPTGPAVAPSSLTPSAPPAPAHSAAPAPAPNPAPNQAPSPLPSPSPTASPSGAAAPPGASNLPTQPSPSAR